MHRRDVLAASGALTVAALAGCTDGALNSPDTDSGATNSSIDLPTGIATAADEQLAELATGNATFGLELYHQLVGSNSGNLFLSPYSVSAALAMTYAGARGETRQEMTEVFEFTQGEAVHPAVSALREQLASREDVPEHEYEGTRRGSSSTRPTRSGASRDTRSPTSFWTFWKPTTEQGSGRHRSDRSRPPSGNGSTTGSQRGPRVVSTNCFRPDRSVTARASC